jgi:hypothetical protein
MRNGSLADGGPRPRASRGEARRPCLPRLCPMPKAMPAERRSAKNALMRTTPDVHRGIKRVYSRAVSQPATSSASHNHCLKGGIRLRLTIDSSEALEDTLRVVGALYNVTLGVSPNATASSGADQGTGTAAASARRTRGTRGSAGRRPGNRRTSNRAPRKRVRGAARANADAEGQVNTAAVRSWARENGYTVADRGRVPSELVTAYRNAQPV